MNCQGGFLYIYQLAEGLVLDVATGKKFLCSAWTPPGITDDDGKDVTPEPHVDITLHKMVAD